MPKSFSIVLPCLDEHDCIVPLIMGIGYVKKRYRLPVSDIVLIDDSARDLTERIIEKMKKAKLATVPINLIRRGRANGLSSAIFDGSRAAKSNFVIVMDADGQHRPRDLVGIWRALQKGAGIVVGSRHAKGGKIASEWGVHRRIISRASTALSHGLAGYRTKDPLSGFFGFSKKAVKLEKMRPVGYKFLLELLVRNPKAKVEDVPITFLERKAGKTKLGLKQMEEFGIDIARLHAIKLLRAA
jgi:dolichol-phosphate mannosyltransferase